VPGAVTLPLPALLDTAARLARRAGAAILAARARGCAATIKPDATPVTEADHEAEAIILAGLAALGIPVVAEEAEAAGAQAVAAPVYWLVDPLDGTREFAAGRDAFAVNIGLVQDGRPALGVVFLPARDQLFAGIPGHGAWRNGAPIATRSIPRAGPTVFASHHYADDPRIADFAARHRAAAIVNVGSAEKFCRLAEGSGDLYPRFGPTMEWDTAAPQAILEAAGGRVIAADGAPLSYGKPGWRNPDFLATGRA
jgi:3'(2'), 5'-bisphosphate nucleotidase